jgi:hypothetical protein
MELKKEETKMAKQSMPKQIPSKSAKDLSKPHPSTQGHTPVSPCCKPDSPCCGKNASCC